MLNSRRITRRIVISVIIFLSIVLLIHHQHQQTTIKTIAVTEGSITETIEAPGQIVPQHISQIRSAISGIVAKLLVHAGEQVKKGQILISISPTPTPDDTLRANSAVNKAKINLLKSQHDWHRNKQMYQLRVIAKETLDNYTATYFSKKNDLLLAQNHLKLLEQGSANIGGHHLDSLIKSPMQGTVLKINIHQGDSIVPVTEYQSGTPLLVVADLSRLEFHGIISQLDVQKIHLQQAGEIYLQSLSNETIKATVSSIAWLSEANDPSNNTQSQSNLFHIDSPYANGYQVIFNKLQLAGYQMLRAGLVGNAELVIKKHTHALLLPEQAIFYSDQASPYVWLKQNGQFIKHSIKLGLSSNEQVEITSGLKLASRVALSQPTSE